MKTATVTDLQKHFSRLAAWIEDGESVEITKSGRPFARLMSATSEKPRTLVKPDIMAQLNKVWGDRIFSTKEITEMRAAEFDGEEKRWRRRKN